MPASTSAQSTGSVGTEQIAPRAITGPLIAQNAITAEHLADGVLAGGAIAAKTVSDDFLITANFAATIARNSSI